MKRAKIEFKEMQKALGNTGITSIPRPNPTRKRKQPDRYEPGVTGETAPKRQMRRVNSPVKKANSVNNKQKPRRTKPFNSGTPPLPRVPPPPKKPPQKFLQKMTPLNHAEKKTRKEKFIKNMNTLIKEFSKHKI